MALAAEQYNPHTFSRMVFVNPQPILAAKVTPCKRDIRKKRILQLPVIGTFLYHCYHTRKQIASKTLLNDFYNPAKIPENYVNQCYEAAHLGGKNAKAAFCSLSAHFVNLPIDHFIKQIQIPVALIGGSMEDSISETMDSYILCNPAIRIYLMDHTIHLPHLEDPESFIKLLHSIFSF